MLLLALLPAAAAAAPGARGEAYVTLMYGDAGKLFRRKQQEFACVTAVNGYTLKTLDPARRRTALVNEYIGPESRALLEAGGWALAEVNMTQAPPEGFAGPRAFPKWEAPSDDPQPDVVYDEMDRMGRKTFVWGLPLKRALFFDADYLFLNHAKAGADLRGLWKLPRGRLYAMKSGWDHSHPGRCFNSGLMLLEPGDPDKKLIKRALWDARALPGGLARCKGHDQRLLNSVFLGRWTNLLAIGAWSATSAKLFNRSADGAEALRGARAKLAREDAIHFHYSRRYPGLGPFWRELVAGLPPAVLDACGPDLAWLTNEGDRR